MQSVVGWPHGAAKDTRFADGHASTERRLGLATPSMDATTLSPGTVATSTTNVGVDGQSHVAWQK